ncbi:MAG: hypothetical protein HA493_03625 [Candidatus Verstraetearchaeota archaeon]|nr:hypothetical protein [Candidatus Verstraetearchaeota archaeon]
MNSNKFTLISILLVIGAFILFLLSSFMDQYFIGQYTIANKIIMFIGLILLIASWGIYFMGLKQVKPQTTENVITVIACKNCNYREERPFMEGDYVFKELGSCKKCSGTSYIHAIYLVSVKK